MTAERFTFKAIHAHSLAAVLALVPACGDPGAPGLEDDPGALSEPFSSAAAVISVPNRLQTIAGFGASSAWTAPNLSDELSDQLFSAELGIGLSLLRLRIAPNGTSGEFPTARKAISRGAQVWAADQLASFVVAADAAGVPLLYLSAQNEPNYFANWETCRWSETDLTRFMRDHLGPAVEALGLGPQLLAPETRDWLTLESLLVVASNLGTTDIAQRFTIQGADVDSVLRARRRAA